MQLDAALLAAGLPLALYEGARAPKRQVELYARGRGVGETGKTVTRARAWESLHQFGVAVDYVFLIDGAWTWPRADDPRWREFQGIGEKLGLRSLSFEKPHLELPIHLSSLRAGVYPDGGDASWRDWLEGQIESWGAETRTIGGIVHPAAPPLMVERPAIVA